MNKITSSILLINCVISSLCGQKIYGVGKSGLSVLNLSNQSLSIVSSEAKDALIGTGFATSDVANSKYYYVRLGTNQVDTLVTINVLTGEILAKDTIGYDRLRNPEYYNGNIYGFSWSGGFEKFDLLTKTFTALNKNIQYSGSFQSYQSLDDVSKRYLYYSYAPWNAPFDTVRAISVVAPYTVTTYLVTNQDFWGLTFYQNNLYGFTRNGFVKLHFESNTTTILNSGFKPSSNISKPCIINRAENSYILRIRGTTDDDTIFNLSLWDGKAKMVGLWDRTIMQNPEYFGPTNDLDNLNTADQVVRVFPNPTSAYVLLECVEEIKLVQIFNLKGVKLLETKTKGAFSQNLDISLLNEPLMLVLINGKYQLQIIRAL